VAAPTRFLAICHLVMRSEADWFLDWRTVNTETVSSTCTSRSFQDSTTAKLSPPPPLIAQKRSSPMVLLFRSLPSASRRRASRTLLEERSYLRISVPNPPPLRCPPTADPRGEHERVGGHADGVIELAERGAGPDPCLSVRGVGGADSSGARWRGGDQWSRTVDRRRRTRAHGWGRGGVRAGERRGGGRESKFGSDRSRVTRRTQSNGGDRRLAGTPSPTAFFINSIEILN
jgi:hypothetical protein